MSYELPVPPIVQAVRSTTGTGKTSIFADVMAEVRLQRRAAGMQTKADRSALGYFVPTHELSEDVADLWRERGLTARVYYGREHEIDGEPMCLNLLQVKLAREYGLPIAESCCKSKDARCSLFGPCRWQGQFPAEDEAAPDVWVAAHQLLFHEQRRFDNIAGVCVDESFWEAGIWGLGTDKWHLDIAEIGSREIPSNSPSAWRLTDLRLADLRKRLAQALAQQKELGGLQRHHLEENLIPPDCGDAIRMEFALMPKLDLHPGMSKAALRNFRARNRQAIRDREFAQKMIKLWEAARDMLHRPEIKISGRIVIEENDRKRCVTVRGILPVRQRWQKPTMIMDATLPDLPVLQAYYPQVQLVADIQAKMPEGVFIRQLVKAPVSKKRLITSKRDTNRNELRRYILRRWIETGRQRTLVISQLEYENWLRASGLPESIELSHYNAIAGLDRFRDVRLLILIGRVVPGPEVVEDLAGALTGSQPKKLPHGTWYPAVKRGIRLPDGTGRAVTCDQHPDPVAEMVRFQLCECELVQAMGRGRGVNRTPETPLDIDIIADVCLPIAVNEVLHWSKEVPNAMVEAAAEGAVLLSRVDMAAAWPKVWRNDTAAKRTLEELRKGSTLAALRRLLVSWQAVTYQLDGPKMKQRIGYFDRALIPNPQAWLVSRLSPLADFMEGGPELGDALLKSE